MARTKGRVIGPQEEPKSEKAAGAGLDALETPSGSLSTSSTNLICPHCNSVFQEMSIKVRLPYDIVDIVVLAFTD
jgi:hypothetical protein